MQSTKRPASTATSRRQAVRSGLLAGGAMFVGGLAKDAHASDSTYSDSLSKGDIAILRFLAAAEIIEIDRWVQCAELGGIASTANYAYRAALSNLGSDGPQYITSNTLDEQSHADFLNAY